MPAQEVPVQTQVLPFTLSLADAKFPEASEAHGLLDVATVYRTNFSLELRNCAGDIYLHLFRSGDKKPLARWQINGYERESDHFCDLESKIEVQMENGTLGSVKLSFSKAQRKLGTYEYRLDGEGSRRASPDSVIQIENPYCSYSVNVEEKP